MAALITYLAFTLTGNIAAPAALAVMSVVASPAPPTSLPKPVFVDVPTAPTFLDHPTMTVVLEKDGMYLDGRAAMASDVERRLRELNAKDPQTRVIVDADESLPYERVLAVMDLVQKAGATRIAIATHRR